MRGRARPAAATELRMAGGFLVAVFAYGIAIERPDGREPALDVQTSSQKLASRSLNDVELSQNTA